MAAKKAGLKKVRREEWRVQLEKLAKENPLVSYTDASRTFSMVRRMKAEKRPDSPEAALIETWISLHRARPRPANLHVFAWRQSVFLLTN